MHIFQKGRAKTRNPEVAKHVLHCCITLLSCVIIILLLCCTTLLWINFKLRINYRAYYVDPIRSSDEDEILSLPGLNYKPNFKHYSGYLEADKNHKKFIHYWFIESQTSSLDARFNPIVLWLNGGPGCSSLYGVLNEIGPYKLNDNARNGYGDNVLIENPFSWNKNANLLFFESPAQVGWSYNVHGDSEPLVDDRDTVIQNFNALSQFLNAKFSHLRYNSLYLTGESYGGIYLPMLADMIDTDGSINLRGLAIGNGYFHERLQVASRVLAKYQHKLYIGDSAYLDDKLKRCCNLEETLIDYQCRDLPKKCPHLQLDDVYKHDEFVDYYNVRRRCDPARDSKGTMDDASRLELLKTKELKRPKLERQRPENPFLMFIGCVDRKMRILNEYLNRNDVLDAINVPTVLQYKKVGYTVCNENLAFKFYKQNYAVNTLGMAPFFHHLMVNRRNKRRYKIILYNGDQDFVCTHMGIEWFLTHANISATSDYSEWRLGDQVAGLIKQYENGLTLLTVKDAGHSVAHDKPAEAEHVLRKYLLNITEHS